MSVQILTSAAHHVPAAARRDERRQPDRRSSDGRAVLRHEHTRAPIDLRTRERPALVEEATAIDPALVS